MLAESSRNDNGINFIATPRWLFILVLMLMSTAGLVGSDVYLPALPQMGLVFQKSTQEMQFTLGIYLCGLSIGQLIFGPLTDQFGRKKLLLMGMLLYFTASLLCAFIYSYDFLLFARFLQAIGACSGLIIGRAIVGDLFDAQESGRIFATIFPIVGMSPAISPVIGGIICYYYGWQSTFMFVGFFALITAILVLNYLPETHGISNRTPLKLAKIASSYPKILFHAKFVKYAIAPCAAYFAYFAYIAQSPYIFHSHGYTEREIGTFYITLSISYVVGNITARKLLATHHLDKVVGLGFIFFNVGAIALFAAGIFTQSLLMMVISISILTFGNGFLIPLGTAGVISSFPEARGYASGLLGFIQLGSAALSAAMVGQFSQHSIYRLATYILIVTILGVVLFSICSCSLRNK